MVEPRQLLCIWAYDIALVTWDSASPKICGLALSQMSQAFSECCSDCVGDFEWALLNCPGSCGDAVISRSLPWQARLLMIEILVVVVAPVVADGVWSPLVESLPQNTGGGLDLLP